MEKIEIQLSKTKLFWQIGGSVCFMIFGAFLTEFVADQQSQIAPVLLKAGGLLSILFFGATAIYGTRKIFDKKIGLIIDSKGITDNSSGLSARFIDWKEVKGIRSEQINSTKILLIDTFNPDKYISDGNKFRKRIMMLNLKMYGTPLFLSSNTLQINFSELENILREALKKHQ